MKNLLKQEYSTKKKTFNGKKHIDEDIKYSIEYHTSFLNFSAPLSLRYQYIVNDIMHQKICNTCQTPLKTLKNNYCSVKCSASNTATKQSREKTVKEKYGVNNVSKSNSIKNKIKETSLKRYGVDNPAKSEVSRLKIKDKSTQVDTEIKNLKRKTTTQIKYGVDHISQLSCIKEKVKQSFQKKYNKDSYFQTQEFKDRYISIMQSKYGIDNPSKDKLFLEKIKKTKIKNHGDSTFNNREKANKTMLEKYGDHCSRLHWTNTTRSIMLDKTLLEEFVQNETINHAARSLQVGPTTLRNKLYEHDIISYKQRKNHYEHFIEQILKSTGISYTKNDRSILNGKEIDFYIKDASLAIELNGIFWHSELMGKTSGYHLEKTKLCEQKKIQLLHIWDYQVDKNPQLIKSMIMHKLNQSKNKLYARNTHIVECDSEQYRKFLTENHIEGSVNSSIRYGLVYQNNLVAVMGFGKSRFNKNEYELYRFAVKQNYNLVGAAGKLFKNFLKLNTIDRIVSFADRNISQGSLYKELGFKLIKTIPPSYKYFKNRKIYNRIAFQKHKLDKILENYNKNLTEWENMQNHGYNRFWNTGQFKYEYTR